MSRGNPYEYCPECNSQNVERTGMMIEGAPVAVIRCYHCDGVFRKHHPGYESTGVKWVRVT